MDRLEKTILWLFLISGTLNGLDAFRDCLNRDLWGVLWNLGKIAFLLAIYTTMQTRILTRPKDTHHERS